MTTEQPLAFRVRHVSCERGDNLVLDDVSLDVKLGQILALVGPNGAGKSTLLSTMSGDLRPTAGAVELNGSAIENYSAKQLARERAVLLQANTVSFAFSVQDVVHMGRTPWMKTSDEETDARLCEQAMRDADVEHLAHRSFQALSGGEKARSSLARVLAQDTPIVLLDEPTASLDLRHQEDVMVVARRLADAGRAVVVVLHDLSLAAAWADEVVILAEGRLVHHGPPQDVITAQTVRSVYGIDVHVLTDPSGRLVVVPERA
ncbi:MAG: heme ABC transporter ATP-binding protein [Actinomycetales bacterium]|nr:heme ABC transporter ATP-binding protein [Actinomycetales bacterium]